LDDFYRILAQTSSKCQWEIVKKWSKIHKQIHIKQWR